MDQDERHFSYERGRVLKYERRRAQIRRKQRIFVVVTLAALVAVVVCANKGMPDIVQEPHQEADAQAASSRYLAQQGGVQQGEGQQAEAQQDGGQQAEAQQDGGQQAEAQQTVSQQQLSVSVNSAIVEEADRLAAMYDYDSAIALLQGEEGYQSNAELQKKVKKYQATKDSCVSWPIEKVTHVFYHTLIVDPSKAFDGDSKEGGYNQVMTTVKEFNAITQSMYEKGFVMVSIKDMASVVTDDDGNRVMQQGEILLPPGKQPFVLSQDDVSYYHYMEGDGCASKLVVNEEGQVKNEYEQEDGEVSVGDYDVIPLIDQFVEQHPDFSYRGAKGIIALTGYNGVLGYYTDIAYKTRENLDEIQVKYLQEHPDFNYDEQVSQAKIVAAALRESGWEFASHTWGHINVGERSLEDLQSDTEKWKAYVEPIVESTDIIVFAFGSDICGAEDYSGDKFNYLKEQGFDYYCNVDSSQYWVQLRDTYLRMGRRNLDGYRMYYQPELLSDLFDAASVFDSARPTPVPTMS